MRTALLLTAAVTLAAGARAQDGRPWAEKLFTEAGSATVHDFKTVAHGSVLVHKFAFKNHYKVPLDITITKISCGCVQAVSSTKTVQPHDTGSIDVTMNARQFTGARQVAIFVQFANPNYYSTAELKLTAISRTDVVFNPGQLDFGAVPQGQSATKEIEVDYAGALEWQIHEVVNNSGLPVEVRVERKRPTGPKQVGYKLTAALKGDAPVGPIKGELLLHTNDPQSPYVPLTVEANVQASVSVTPSPLRLTGLKVGEEKRGRVVVRGAKDFRILGVDGQGDGVTVEAPAASASAAHTLTVVVKPAAAGPFRKTLLVRTDLQKEPVSLVVEGTVAP